eukprot:gene4994-9987_t
MAANIQHKFRQSVETVNKYFLGKLSDVKSGSEAFNYFCSVVSQEFITCSDLGDIINTDMVYRRYDDLEDYIFNWEFDLVSDRAKLKCQNFDLIDIIFLSGGFKVLPWDVGCHQLITLLHMADFASKPVLTCGGGTYISIFATAISGTRFEIINTPIGHSLNKLPLFGFYSTDNTTVLSGTWLDNETGDLYAYNPDEKTWSPVANVGCHRVINNLSNDNKVSSTSRRPWIKYS